MNRSAVIARLEQQFSQTLLTLLDDMFASCDDLFFDLASRATTNTEQNLYFESMRETRVRTRATRDDYRTGLEQLFKSAANTKGNAGGQNPGDLSLDEMQLVDKDEVELEVAISAMTGRARAVTKTPLFELGSRLSSLYNFKMDDPNDTPLEPGALIKLFADAMQPMVLDVKARIILLKQYERYVVNRLSELYKNTNKLLQEQGVEFKDQGKIRKQKSRARPSNVSDVLEPFDEEDLPLLSSSYEPGYRYGTPAFSDLTQLLSTLRGMPTGSGSGGGRSQIPLFTSGAGTAIPNQELLRLLDNTPPIDYSQNPAIDLRDYIGKILTQGLPKGETRAVQQVDEDVINLVAMFFDFVLDDKNIPDSVKTLVSRLQMPILKIALKDKRFFSDTEHPAREFINEVARVSIGADDDSTDAQDLLEQIEEWVHDIQMNVEDTETAFVQALKDLRQYSENFEKRAELVQKRTSEAVAGQAKKELATLRSQRAIQEAMDGKSVAVPVSEFILKHWQQVLYVTFVKQGEESPVWLSQLQTMQDLIWCSQRHSDEKSRQRYERISETLFDKLSEGLDQTTLTDKEIGQQVDALKLLLEKIAEPQSDDAEVKIETFEASSEESLNSLKQQKGWKEMTALERQKVQFQALTYEFIERAEAIKPGSWLEFKESGSGAIIRCKLAAKLEGSDTYVFVNRLGFKALEKPRKEFAFDLQRKRARLLRTGPLFDRSLHKMVTNLRKIAQ